jgi:hypothetical protein
VEGLAAVVEPEDYVRASEKAAVAGKEEHRAEELKHTDRERAKGFGKDPESGGAVAKGHCSDRSNSRLAP